MMKKLLLLLLLISMQSHSMEFLNRISNYLFDKRDPFPLLELPDDMIREIVLWKINNLINQYSAKERDLASLIDSNTFCKTMALTCRKMRSTISSEPFCIALAKKFQTFDHSCSYRRVIHYHSFTPFIKAFFDLIKKKDPKFPEEELFLKALEDKKFRILELLIENNEDSNTLIKPFFTTVKNHCIPGIKLLLKQVAIDAQDEENNTALHIALQSKETLDIARYLLEQGASSTIKNKNGDTALELAQKKYKIRLELSKYDNRLYQRPRDGQIIIYEYLINLMKLDKNARPGRQHE